MDAGDWMLETGYWILDTGYWGLDAGFLGSGIWVLITNLSIDHGPWTMVYGQKPVFHVWGQN
jgi:hypothetical protein